MSGEQVPIPLTLVTGFLGSGKTTLLQRIIDQYGNRRLGFVVNEFGAVDVDGSRLELRDGELVSIPGGSIFCRCLSGEFIRHLQRLHDEVHRERPLEGVIIEASGMADPKVIGLMLVETGLDRFFQLRSVISVVDPGSFLKLIHTLPAVVSQVEAAGVVMINKIDLYDAVQVARVAEAIRRINPQAELLQTRYCQVELNPFQALPHPVVQGSYALSTDPHFVSYRLRIARAVDRDRLAEGLNRLRERVYRVKGYIRADDEWFSVDVSPAAVTLTPLQREMDEAFLVCITSPENRGAIDEVAEVLAGI